MGFYIIKHLFSKRYISKSIKKGYYCVSVIDHISMMLPARKNSKPATVRLLRFDDGDSPVMISPAY